MKQPLSRTAAAALLVFTAARVLLGQPTNNPELRFADSQFNAKLEIGAIVSLKNARDPRDIEFVMRGRRLGDMLVRHREAGENWQSVTTTSLTNEAVCALSDDQSEYTATYRVTNRDSARLALGVRFKVSARAVDWSVTLGNLTDRPLEIGDLALPLPMNSSSRQGSSWVLKHGLVSGHGSFLYWMRPDSVGPYLVLVPSNGTKLEYWDAQSREYRMFTHSAAAGAEAEAQGAKWRQPHTSLTLSPRGKAGDSETNSFRFRWADDYDGVRQVLVEEGGMDVHVVPGMTVPNDLSARIALRTKQAIKSVEAEFPTATKIESLGPNGDYRIYQIQFRRLGENRLTIHYGESQHMFLEFFSTEPIETLIKKRGAFLARSQHRDPGKWYNGLITDWNMATQKLLSPDDYAPIPRNRYYAVTCDDPGLGKPAFLAGKNAEFPVQSEVEALDYYIKHFVWGGLQRMTNESYAYGVYGIPDWKTNRESNDAGRTGQLHLWRIYDYPHVIAMYLGMYRVAKHHPQITTALGAREYLQRAAGTALAMFTVPHEVWPNWSPYGTGFYNEVVLVDLMVELEGIGMKAEADELRGHWEHKVRNFVNREQDLFRSEYAFDSTGFESTHALARYAMLHAVGSSGTNSGIPLENARRFMEKQMTANLFCRGTIEPAYYLLGSDYRGGGGNAYTLTYMSQMGGWGVLDYALNFATNPAPYLRLGYASYLSAWALMNTGTPESNYGYWFPGNANDGGAGGGFEPAPSGRTWLGQPHHRGSWGFACEIDLGYCGALRTAATVLADDPIFGRYCFGGDWQKTPSGVEIIPKDGLRRRCFAMLGGTRLSLHLETDRFAMLQPIKIEADFSKLEFTLESDNPKGHVTELLVSGLAPGDYSIGGNAGPVSGFSTNLGQGAVVKLLMDVTPKRFTITRKNHAAPLR